MLPNESLDRFLDDFLEGGKPKEKYEVKKREDAAPVRSDRELWVPPADGSLVEKPESRKLSKRTWAALLMIFVLIPLTIFIGIRIGDRKYFFISMMIMVYSMVPFVMVFEGRRPQARELVILALLAAIAVAGRAAFFMLPQFKPVIAVVIVAGVCFGAESGFLVGAVSMFASNFFLTQGPWTPWQMFAMGCIGGLAGSLFSRRGRRPRKGMLCLFGFLAAVVLYGAVMNTASVLLWSHSLQWELIAAACAAGLPMDLLHGGSTALLLYLLADPVQGKLDRMREKYGWGRG